MLESENWLMCVHTHHFLFFMSEHVRYHCFEAEGPPLPATPAEAHRALFLATFNGPPIESWPACSQDPFRRGYLDAHQRRHLWEFLVCTGTDSDVAANIILLHGSYCEAAAKQLAELVAHHEKFSK